MVRVDKLTISFIFIGSYFDIDETRATVPAVIDNDLQNDILL